MHGELKHADVEVARRDLADRTLAKIRGDFARLIYLASMRDYNTGEYHHEGLACRFTECVAGRAIASCHRDAFRRLVLCSLKELVEQLELYAGCKKDRRIAVRRKRVRSFDRGPRRARKRNFEIQSSQLSI